MKMLKIIFVSLFACMFMLNENVEGMTAAQAVARLKDIYIKAYSKDHVGGLKVDIKNLCDHVTYGSKHLIYCNKDSESKNKYIQSSNEKKTCIVLQRPEHLRNSTNVYPSIQNLCDLIGGIGEIVRIGEVIESRDKRGEYFVDIVCKVNIVCKIADKYRGCPTIKGRSHESLDIVDITHVTIRYLTDRSALAGTVLSIFPSVN